jgi:hypothetical protein
LANSRWSDSYWASKSSSGISALWNIVKLNAVPPPGSGTTRVGKTAIWSFVGPANMSMTPVSSSASMAKKNSPRPFTTL